MYHLRENLYLKKKKKNLDHKNTWQFIFPTVQLYKNQLKMVVINKAKAFSSDIIHAFELQPMKKQHSVPSLEPFR